MEIGMELITSLVLLLASIAGLWLARPKGGRVRPFLRNDQVQAYYAVALLAAFVVGLIFTALGLASLFS
jgi:hypothetical protein